MAGLKINEVNGVFIFQQAMFDYRRVCHGMSIYYVYIVYVHLLEMILLYIPNIPQ